VRAESSVAAVVGDCYHEAQTTTYRSGSNARLVIRRLSDAFALSELRFELCGYRQWIHHDLKQ